MTKELKQLVAFLFQRSGKELLPAQEIYMTLSYELGWLTPGEAKKLMVQAVEQGLLQQAKDGYTPTFVCQDVEIPLGFQISGSMVEDVSTTLISDNMVEEVLVALGRQGLGGQEAQRRIEETSRDQHIIPEAAALVVALQQGLDTQHFFARAWKAVKKL